jgi:hypothetical protein
MLRGMSQSIISWKKIQKLNRATGERFVHASTRDTNIWHAVRHDGSAAWVRLQRIKHVGTVYWVEPDPNPDRWYSCNLLRSRQPGRWAEDADSLAEWDRRAAEL